VVLLFFFFFFPLSGAHEKCQSDKSREQDIYLPSQRYAAQGKLPVHHSLPACISLGSGRPVSNGKSTNQFFMTVQSRPLCWHQPFLCWWILSHIVMV